VPLASGAEMRRTGLEGAPAVLCLNGGVARALPGDWSTSVDWLVRRLAPWIPDEVGVGGLAGRRVAVIQGSIDGRPFGVSPRHSRRAVERMRARGIEASYAVVRGGLHAIALPGPGDALLPLPRAGAWARLVGAELDRFQATA
jgi:hypothetical protein